MHFDMLMHTSKAMSDFANKLFAGGHIEASLIADEEAIDYCTMAIDAEHIHIESMLETGCHLRLVVDNTHQITELKEVK